MQDRFYKNNEKIAFITQRYGKNICGGLELHSRLLSHYLKNYYEIEVLTTCFGDANVLKKIYKSGVQIIDGITVRRFNCKINKTKRKYYSNLPKHRIKNLSLLKKEECILSLSPYSQELNEYIKSHKNIYKFLIFFNYCTADNYFGIKIAPHKSILLPIAHDKAPFYWGLFDKIFYNAKAIVYNSPSEKKMIEKKYDKKRLSKINDIIGIGIDIEDHKFSKLSRNHYGNYILYAGRIDTYKGSRELMEFFLRYVKERNKKLNLVMIGRDYLGLPKRRNVIKLGYVSQNKKFNLLRHAKVVINPSFYESLSMLLLEAFFCAKPALVNGNCKVLKDQIIRSGAGLYYTNYDSFSRNLTKLLSNTRLRKDMGVKGRLFFNRYYAKEIIQFKYLKIFDKLINPKN